MVVPSKHGQTSDNKNNVRKSCTNLSLTVSTQMALIIVILLRLGMRRQKLSLQNRMRMLLTMKAAWVRKVRVKMIRRAFTMMKMVEMMRRRRRKRMITKYQDYNWYNSSVITERKDNHMLQIIYYKEGKNEKVKMKIIR